MAGVIDELKDVLEYQRDCYIDLLEIANIKKNCIVEKDFTLLSEVIHREEEFIARNTTIDKKRTELLTDIKLALNIKKEEATLADLIHKLDDRLIVKSQIIELRLELIEIAGKLKRQNELIRALINDSMELVNFSLTALHGAMIGTPSPTYSSYGDNSKSSKSLFDSRG